MLEEVERLDDEELSSNIVILPPINSNVDENSEGEENVTVDNLPGSKLWAEAEITFKGKEDDIQAETDSLHEDDLPLSRFG